MLTKIKSSVSMSSFHPLQPYFSQLSIINLNPRPDLLRLPNLLYFSKIFQGPLQRNVVRKKATKGLRIL